MLHRWCSEWAQRYVWLYVCLAVCLSGRSSGVCTCVCVYVSLHSCPPAATERIRLRLGLIVTNTLRPVAITYLAVWPLTLACHRLWNAATACSSGADAAQVMLKNLIRVLPLYGLRFSVTNTPRPVIFHWLTDSLTQFVHYYYCCYILSLLLSLSLLSSCCCCSCRLVWCFK